MEKSIFLLLIFSIILSVSGYYLGFIKPQKNLVWLAKSSFFLATFLLIPLFVLVLWLQNGAKTRLEQAGIVPHPSIRETIGIGFGIGNNPAWVFKIDSKKESVMSFYLEERNRPGWILLNHKNSFLVFEKDGKELIIGFYEGWTSSSISYNLMQKE